MSAIVFLEVDAEDTKTVQEQVPSAFVTAHTSTEALEQCKEAEIISCFLHSPFGKKQLDACPNLKLLCTRTVGYDHIDIEEYTLRGITVCNVPDYGSHVIAEHVFALLLGTLRYIHEGDKRVEGGTFSHEGLRGMALRGKTIGIVGTGKIGRSVAQIAHGFGMHILAVDMCRTMDIVKRYNVRYVELETLLQQSDVISLHLPANEQTHHMINEQTLAAMKPGIVLVNTARGALIDSNALLQALDNRHIAHALLDVLEHEKNFEENRKLINHPRVVVTPHIAFYADESMQNMYDDCIASIHTFQHGNTPEHIVKPLSIVCDLPGVSQSTT